MSTSEIAALIGTIASLIVAVTGLVQAFRAQAAVDAHVQAHAAKATSATRPTQPPSANSM